MTNSRDVKALFGRFGGNATSYQEIGMENEASDARRRWPLLGMTDPAEVALPAADAPADRLPVELDRFAPFDAHAARRDVQPVMEKEIAASPVSSASRFSLSPVHVAASEDANDIQPDADSTTASSEPLARSARTERSLPERAGELVLTDATPLRKLFVAPTTTLAAGSAQPVSTDKSAQLDALFDRLRTGNTSPRPAAKQQAEVPVRPWFLGGGGQR